MTNSIEILSIIIFLFLFSFFLVLTIIRFTVKFLTKRKKIVVNLGLILFLLLSAFFFVAPKYAPSPDYTQGFDYKLDSLGGANITKATELHSIMVGMGFRDPTGLIFADIPSNDMEWRQHFTIKKTTPYYQLNDGTKNIDTLLVVPTDWVDNTITLHVRQFLEIPSNISHLVEIRTDVKTDAFGVKFVNVYILIKTPDLQDWIDIILQYKKDGFAVVNVLYSEINDYNKNTILYLETTYVLDGQFTITLSLFLSSIFMFLIAIFWAVITKAYVPTDDKSIPNRILRYVYDADYKSEEQKLESSLVYEVYVIKKE